MTLIEKYQFPKNRLRCLRDLDSLILSSGLAQKRTQDSLRRVQLVLACLEIAKRGQRVKHPGFVCFENRLLSGGQGTQEDLYFLLTETKGPVALLHLSVKRIDPEKARSREVLSTLYFSRKTHFVRVQPGAWQKTVDDQVQRLLRQQDRLRLQKVMFWRHIACGMNTV
ncbi:MAG: hypothetical protein PHD48_01140 [Alphaproteobacteria bacterium]|nr:hypothetical protein [Alphaproteobacteria bacterium]